MSMPMVYTHFLSPIIFYPKDALEMAELIITVLFIIELAINMLSFWFRHVHIQGTRSPHPRHP